MCESISCCLQGSAKRCDKSPAVRSPVSESFYSRYLHLFKKNKQNIHNIESLVSYILWGGRDRETRNVVWRKVGERKVGIFQGFQLISSGLELNPGRRRHWHWQGAVAKFSPPHATLPATLLLLLLLLHNFSHLENPMKANFERQAAKMSFLQLQICQNWSKEQRTGFPLWEISSRIPLQCVLLANRGGEGGVGV